MPFGFKSENIYSSENLSKAYFKNSDPSQEIGEILYKAKPIEISSTTNSNANPDGFYGTLPIIINVGKRAKIISVINQISSKQPSYSYNSDTGQLDIVSLYGYYPNATAYGIVNIGYYLWTKPYNLILQRGVGVKSVEILRTKTNEPLATSNYYLGSGDKVYFGDVLSISATAENGYKLNDYVKSITVNDINSNAVTINVTATSLAITKIVSVTTGKLAFIGSDGKSYYSGNGSVNIGTNRTNVSISSPYTRYGVNNTINYNSTTGIANYTIFGTQANATATATISYYE